MNEIQELYKWIGENNLPSDTGIKCQKDTFKNNICHCVKSIGDINFLLAVLKSKLIDQYWIKGNYFECFYLLGMTDYLSRLNKIPVCTNYAKIRHCRLSEPFFPNSLIFYSHVMHDDSILKKAVENAIPEFKRFNIIENEVKDNE